MGKHKKTLWAVFVCCLFLLTSCGPNMKTIKRYQMMESGVSSPTTIEELKAAIDKYEEKVLVLSSAQEQIGVWYKLLATRYVDKGMYGEALATLEKAVQYFPANQNLYYYIGLSAGYMAKSALDFNATGSTAKRDNYLLLSEAGYKRAIELQNDYSRALYGLAVLYVFEMNQSERAIPLLEQLLQKEPKHTDAQFVLARAYYMNYDFDNAIRIYDDILKTTTSQQKKADAEANKKVALDAKFANGK